MPAELHLSFKQARYYHAGRIDVPLFIVIHDIGVLKSESTYTAESTQNFFVRTTVEASAHVTADSDSLARSVHDWDTAFGAPGVNANGLHLEQAGTNQSYRDWRDKYSLKMIEEQSAKMTADWSIRHRIPLVKRSSHDIRNRRAGVIGHYDASAAFNTPGGHTDPDTAYPWNRLLGAAQEHVQDLRRPVIVHNPYATPRFPNGSGLFSKGAHGDKVRFVQWALGIPVDGSFGKQTFAAVEMFQHKHNLRVDGVVGPQTAAALAHITHVH